MDNGGSPRDALGKLLPKTLSVRRQRRKEKKAAASNDSNSSLGVDDDDNDDDRSARGRSTSPAASGRGSSSSLGARSKRSLGSMDSLQKARQKKRSREKLPVREDSREEAMVGGDGDQQSSSVARPATISAHPSLIGYLTTSSPVVQAEHLDSQHDTPDTLAPALSSKTSNDDVPAAPPLEPPVIAPPSAAKVASPSRRAKPTIEVETRPPRTPPTAETASHAPAIVNTPPTPVEAQTARAFASDWKAPWRGSSPPPSSDGSASSRNMSAHRRARSGSVNHGPSKLSTITTAPLSPPVESVESTASGPSNTSTGGFFSSMLSAAQNAANNISSNIQNSGIGTGPNKSKQSTPAKPQNLNTSSKTSLAPSVDTTPRAEHAMEKKESSLRSIGSGDLSLSHLGLPDVNSGEASPASTKFPELSDQRARSESAPVDISQTPSVDLSRDGSGSRPRSLIEPVASAGEDLPAYDQVDTKLGLHRNSSLRSASKKHRKRGSSVATAGTGNTIGAAIAAANSSLANPTAAAPAPKLTGFAIASKKRNRDFHSIFKSVPDDDYLIEDYSCALQREILAHGRLYVSEGHLCFSSNILGWTTTLVMSFDEIVSVEKRSTALVFKNGLMISTLHAKHIFASFTSRDATYDLIVNIWKLGHPTLTSTLNGVRLEGTGGDKTERPDNESPNAGNESLLESDSAEDSGGEDSEYYDSDENDDASDHPQLADSTVVNGEPDKSVVARKASATSPTGSSPAMQGKESPVASTGETDFPGPSTHAPTDCGDSASHYDRVVGDEVIAAPLGKVYNLLFGQPSGNFMSKWLANDQKCTDVQIDDKKGLVPGNTSRTYSYIKPLGGSIGPRQTKCIVTETLENLDLEKSANFVVSTQTPDVPSGNVFVTKTRYCLSWAENNSTRLQMNCTIEWSGKSWLKGPIEKGANDGQAQFCRDICAALRVAVSSKTKVGALGNTAGRTKRKGKRGKTAQPSGDAAEPQQKHAAKQDWGTLEPLRQLLEPVLDIVQPVLTGNVMYGLLVGLLVATWFRFGFPPSRESPNYTPHPRMGAYFPDRLAAYEEMWRREDSELWDWLEERVGIGRLSPTDVRGSPSGSSSASAAGLNTRKKRPVEPRTLEERLREEKMDGRQVEEAIRVTEEKLEVLREAMQRVHLANGNKTPKQKPISKEAA